MVTPYGFKSRLSHHYTNFHFAKISKVYFAGLCNGSTTDSDSVCEGSSPSPATIKGFWIKFRRPFVFLHQRF